MKKYFLYDGTTQYGPFDLAALETKIITPQTLVWYESLPEWKPAGEIEELKDLLNSKVPASQILTPPMIKAKEEDWSRKMFYYTDDHGQQGPFSLEQLKNRPITATTQVWYDPLPEWTTAGKVAGLKEIIAHTEKNFTPVIAHKEENVKKLYYYLDGAGQQQGPFTLEQLHGKPIIASTLIWYDPLPEWIKAGSEESLKNIIAPAQPVHNTAAAKKLYYYLDNAGHQQGPFSLEQLSGKAITAATLIWYDSLPQWIKAGSEQSLKNIISNGTSTVDWSKKLFYYTDAAGQQGPFTLEQLKGKPITIATPVWYDPLPQWTTAGQVEGLRNIL
jgi:hypothetical protein